jgi:Xaa-Pro aminopeptidase
MGIMRDQQRIESIKIAMKEAGLDALVCTLPANVLLLTGYWPVTGASVGIVTREGYVVIIAPEDERELAEQGWADELELIKPASLRESKSLAQITGSRLREVAKLVDRGDKVGYEEASFEASTYAAMYIYSGAIRELLAQVVPWAYLKPAGQTLGRLRSILTPRELERERAACRIAEMAFCEGAPVLREGIKETEVAAIFRGPLSTRGTGWNGITRADGYIYCRSGANSAKAYADFQRSTEREVLSGDLVLVHCNSYADGFWTDITRTYCLGELDERRREMYEAIFEARAAALNAIKPGIEASEIDIAARTILADRGFGEQFKHALGHGVGFSAIDHNAHPCLHPASRDVLKPGMVFNVEPAIYFEGYGGIRHCDVIRVTDSGAEVLTPFHSRIEDLVLCEVMAS